MENKLSYKFFPSELKKKGSKYPIYLRLTVNRKKIEYFIGHSIPFDEWDSARQKVKQKKDNLHEEINSTIIGLEKKILDIKRELEKEDKLVTATIIKDIITGKSKLEGYVLEMFDQYKKRLEVMGEVKAVTITRYNETKSHLIRFLKEKKKLKDINVKHVNHAFLVDFGMFLAQTKVKHSEECLSTNTINKHHVRLRTILIQAMNEGFIRINPYNKYTLKNVPSEIEYLEEAELNKILNHDLAGNNSLKRVRDIFVFSCFTGLRFQDAMDLEMTNIIQDANKKYWLRTTQNKNSQFVGVPLLKEAIAIIKNYENSPERLVKNKVLPQITNQRFNVYIKEIANLVGIEKHLHHHVSRHTCGTYLLSKGYSLEQVAEWLGQKSTRVTKTYAKITGRSLDAMRDELDNLKQ